MTFVEGICKISYWGGAMLPFLKPQPYDIAAASEKHLLRCQ